VKEVFNEISDKVVKASIPPRVLLSKFRFIDEQSRYSRACLDPHYMPFYYHLGKHCPVENLLEIGFGLGLKSSCYFMGSPGTKHYLSLQEPPDEYYSIRMGVANVKQAWRNKFRVHVGSFHDETFISALREKKWDLVLVDEKKQYDTHLLWLNTVWEEMNHDGLIFVDQLCDGQVSRAYHDFCVVKHREPYIFPTRYKIGVVVK
jgi:predicted O-methyltransferase YrrM